MNKSVIPYINRDCNWKILSLASKYWKAYLYGKKIGLKHMDSINYFIDTTYLFSKCLVKFTVCVYSIFSLDALAFHDIHAMVHYKTFRPIGQEFTNYMEILLFQLIKLSHFFLMARSWDYLICHSDVIFLVQPKS